MMIAKRIKQKYCYWINRINARKYKRKFKPWMEGSPLWLQNLVESFKEVNYPVKTGPFLHPSDYSITVYVSIFQKENTIKAIQKQTDNYRHCLPHSVAGIKIKRQEK